MLGLGLSINRAGRSLLSVIRSGLQMWLGFTKADILGVELVVNGDFSDGNDSWDDVGTQNAQNTNTFIDNSIILVNDGTGSGVNQTGVSAIGTTRQVTINVSEIVGNGFKIYTGISYPITTTGIHIFNVQFTSNLLYLYRNETSPQSINGATILNISIKEVAQFIPDESTNTNNAKLFTGKALSFNGNDYVGLGSISLPNTSNVTFSFWAKPIVVSGSTNYEAVFHYGKYLVWFKSNNTLRVITALDNAVDFAISDPGIEMSRYVVTTSGTSTSLYVNGALLETKTTDALLTTADVSYIGSYADGSMYNYSGLISDFQIYNAAWDSDDAAYDYANPNNLVIDNPNATITKSNLIGYWALSEGSGNIAFDSAGLGGELVTNGNFATDTSGWVVPEYSGASSASLSVANGYLKIEKISASNLDYRSSFASQPITYVDGATYEVKFSLKNGNADNASIYVRSLFSSSSNVNANTINLTNDWVDYTYTFIASASSVDISIGNVTWHDAGIGEYFYADNISVREVTDNDGTGVFLNGSSAVIGATWVHNQPTIPQLGMMDWSKGSNLIEYSEDFSNSYWGKTSLVVELNSVTSPDGFNNGTKIKADATETTYRKIRSTILPADITTYTYSIYVKKAELDFFHINIQTTSFPASSSAWFDLTGFGSVAVSSSGLDSSSITDVGDGWFRCAVTATSDADDANLVSLYMSSSATTSYAGTEGEGLYIYGVQLEQSSTAGSYIGTNGSEAINATLIQNPNDIGKDVLGNSLRLREGGFNLDGSGYAEVADDDTLDFGTGDFSIECWAKFAFLNKTSAWNSIVCLGGGVYRNNSAGLATRVGEFALNVGNSELISTPTLIVGNWYHIVGTRTGSTTRLYIDSVVESLTGTSSQDVTNTLVKMIGDDDDTTTNHDRHYEDLIDDVRLYKNKALSQKEIDNNYKVGLSKHKN